MDMTAEQIKQLAGIALAMADDELILAHRNSEWCGHAPILEEDIAFANLALDELGHAALWYKLHAELLGQDPETYPDRLIFFREPFEFRASQFVVLPKGDWAFSMLRQYLWDALESVRLEALSASPIEPLSQTAAKIRVEEVYHLLHTQAWVRRLGLGTDESNQRMQQALDILWPYCAQLFDLGSGEEDLSVFGLPKVEDEWNRWEQLVVPFLAESGLTVPDKAQRTLSRSIQSQHLIDVLAELQQVARLEPQARW